MAGQLYFISKAQSISDEDINKAGLRPVFGKASFSFRPTNSGPGKQSGSIVVITPAHPEAKTPQVGYFPAQQDWQEADKGKFWVGKEKDNPPRPIDLQRTELIDGHYTKLEDGQDWLVPVARVFPQGTMLPQSLILGPNGELVKEILPRYAKLGQRAEKVWLEFKRQMGTLTEGETSESMDLKTQWDIAIEALSINYRLGPWEVSFLNLLTTENISRILSALVDIPSLVKVAKAQQEALKKKENVSTPDTNNSKDGKQEGVIPTTQQ